MNLGGKWELFFPSELGYYNCDSDSYISGGRVYVFRFERHINVVIT
jgi:FKBP-type peptidyl-prolyl cis-trans isomerase